MPRYHFAVHDGTYEPDPGGIELDDDDAASLAAVRFAGELMRQKPELLLESSSLRVEIRGDDTRLKWIVLAQFVRVQD